MAPTTFKQYWLPEKKGFDCLTLRDVPKEPPKFGQILVRIKAVSLNWRDGILAIGTYPFPGPDAVVPGSDGAGIVEEVGEGVTGWKVGDRVLANFTQDHIAGRLTREIGLTQLGGEIQGLLGEYFIFPQTGIVKIPDYLSFEEASCLPCAALTAWNALYGLTPLRPGQTVLLQGTGGVSTFALQIAHAAGAKTIVTSSSDEKLDKAKLLGATHVVNYRKTPDWAAEAMKITNGKGADYIIEIGGTLTLQASFDAIGFNGQINCIGHITNPDPLGAGKELRGPDAAFLALDRLCVVRGVVVGSREQLQDMLACFEAKSIRPVIDRVFSFDETRAAYDYLWSSTHTGKVVISIPRKKCVENTFPVCGTCIRLNLECVRDTIRRIVPPSRSSAKEATGTGEESLRQPVFESTALTRPLACLPLQTESLRRRHAMNHYIKVLSELLTVSRHNNSFLSDFLPMAIESPALAEALIAYASGHLSSLDSSYTTVSLEARSNALQALSRVVCLPADNPSFTEPILSASLILLTSEVCLGSHSSWYNHLIGAKHLITSAQHQTGQGPEALKATSEGRWVLRNFAYHDIIGSVTLGTKPLLDSKYLEGITDEVDTYLGVASVILAFIAQTTCLSWETTESEAFSSSQQYLVIEDALKSWQCPKDTPPTLEAVASAYRGAALIYLYRKMRQYLQSSDPFTEQTITDVDLSWATLEDNINAEVSTILESVARVPTDDVSEASLLFPLFIAGGEVTDSDQMDAIRQKLQFSFQKRRFRNISRALEVLEGLWALRLRTTDDDISPDWEHILRTSDEPLLLT
ncbi:hypothetical protein CDV36_005871 [Fusarium kuroshium]|uniref:Enoyl reductase (ER) domain-containing protein n=1 Tax=Fusarium kuroshium TaxID=2010991 RepID=A0A3M2SA79_9HYPO|nr:hypothetical protein CDV36_005871 [Fusarium kuroshium]